MQFRRDVVKFTLESYRRTYLKMTKITTDELPQSWQTLFIEVERTKTPLTVIHEGKPLVTIYPAVTQTKRPPSGVMKGTGHFSYQLSVISY